MTKKAIAVIKGRLQLPTLGLVPPLGLEPRIIL